MLRALKKLQTICLCISKINWISFFKLYDSRAVNILWFYPFYREHFFTQSIEREFGVIYSFIKYNVPFRIYIGKKIGRFSNSNIFFFSTAGYNEYGFISYTETLHFISKQLERQNNNVYPTSNECLYWENKIYMHTKFKELNINHPETIILSHDMSNEDLPLPIPFLLKEPHSSSSMGIYKITSQEQYTDLLFGEKQLLKKNNHLIAQRLINMRRDMRITLVGDEICLHYWRINKSTEWRPTATGYGSDVDFVSFPEKWRGYIISECAKFGLNSLGADIAFENDDLTTEPLFLEVSPFYQPNPVVFENELKVPYGVYKKQFKLFHSWDKKFVDIVFELEEKIIKRYV
jgi:hypothetical protein